eukprot:1297273-Rhodomonas_salina.1
MLAERKFNTAKVHEKLGKTPALLLELWVGIPTRVECIGKFGSPIGTRGTLAQMQYPRRKASSGNTRNQSHYAVCYY